MKYFKDHLALRLRAEDEKHIRKAIQLAEVAKALGNPPSGAVLVFPGGQFAECNTTETEGDCTCHAEMNVLRKAAQMHPKRMNEAVLYCSLEPCSMCATMAANYGVKEIIFGAYDTEDGFVSSVKGIKAEAFDLAWRGGLLGEACHAVLTPLMQEFTLPSSPVDLADGGE